MKVRVWGKAACGHFRIASLIFALVLLIALVSAVAWTEKAHSATSSALSISADVPNGLGSQAAGTITLHVTNTGSDDMVAPLLVLQGSDSSLLTLDKSKSGQVLNVTAYPPGFSSTIQVIADGATPGVLKAGESASIPVYFCGLLQPVGTTTQVNFTLSSFETTNTDTVDWSSLQDSMRPGSIGTDAWAPIWANFTANMGNTWGQYVSRLDQDVTYLSGLGENVIDAQDLLGFEIGQAEGFSPLHSLASNTDAAVAAPGLPITFSRSLPTMIAQRYALGPLGRGWSDSWQYSAIQDQDGTVTINGPAGSSRTFFPNGSGGFTDQPGDHGTLTNTGGGTYSLTETTGQLSSFNSDGTLAYIQDTNGNRITAGYTNGLLTSLTHSSGRSLSINYDANGRIVSINDPARGTTTYSYDASDEHLTSVTDYTGKTTCYGYITGQGAAQENALSEIDYPGGNHQYFTYDAQGRLSGSSKDGNAAPMTYAYASGGEIDSTDATGATTKLFLDNRGLTIKTIDPLGHITSNSYDANYDLTGVTDAAGKSFTYTYDANGNMTGSTDPLGHSTQFGYGALSRMTSLKDANGNQTSYTYDASGNTDAITYADGSSESWTYGAQGNPTAKTNGRGHVINYSYDTSGRIIAKSYADGSNFTYTYDAAGNLVSTADSTGTTNFTYTNDLLTRIDYPGSRFLQFTYDDAGRRTSSVDQLGHTLNYSYDSTGRLDHMTNENGQEIVHYEYDAAGRLAKKTVGNGDYTTYQYDADGQLLHLINYKQDGTIISHFDYTYDDRGRRTAMDTNDGTWTYEYDDLGQLTHTVLTSTNPNVPSQNLKYSYDAMGNRTSTVENGVTTNYTTNNMNQYTQTQATKAGDLPLAMRIPRVYWGSYSDYQARELSLDLSISNPSSINAIEVQITDCNSTNGVNISSSLPANAGDIAAGGQGSVTLKYIIPEGVNVFRTSFQGSAKDSAGASHLYPGDTVNGTTNYSYDADGNVVSETSASGNVYYSYDDENKLAGFISPQDNSQYVYGANGSRIQSTENGNKTSSVIDPIGIGNVVGEYDEAGNLIAHYDYTSDLIDQTDAAQNVNYYNFDANGNTSELTGPDGNIVNQYLYTPFGNKIISNENVQNQFQFGGEDGVIKTNSALSYMRNRYYDATSGRFISRDPLETVGGSTNFYSYADNNPLQRIDPTGLDYEQDKLRAEQNMALLEIFDPLDIATIQDFVKQNIEKFKAISKGDWIGAAKHELKAQFDAAKIALGDISFIAGRGEAFLEWALTPAGAGVVNEWDYAGLCPVPPPNSCPVPTSPTQTSSYSSLLGTVVRLTGTGVDKNPQINANGQVVWEGLDSSNNQQIYLYTPGSGVVQLSNATGSNNGSGNPQINTNGQVVWQQNSFYDSDNQIYLYTPGSGVVQLSTNGCCFNYSFVGGINVNGQVVWTEQDGNNGHSQIYLYTPGSGISQISTGSDSLDPRINANGQVVWEGLDSSNNQQIYLYTPGSGISQISTGDNNRYPQINANGQVVWESDNGTNNQIVLCSPLPFAPGVTG